MVTFAQAQERAEEWINGDVPSYQHREVRVREFDLGFVVWAEDRSEGPRSDGGAQRLVIARDSGEATLWPGLPVGEVIRRYEEEYGAQGAAEQSAPAPAARVDLNQTSFLLSPPEWLQEAADKMGIPDRRQGGGSSSGAPEEAGSRPASVSAASSGPDSGVAPAGEGAASGTAWPAAGGDEVRDEVPDGSAGATPWAGTDISDEAGEDRSVPLPATVFAPQVGDADGGTPPPTSAPDAKTALMAGGSRLPRTAVAPALDEQALPGTPPPGVPATPPPGAVQQGSSGGPGTSAPGAPQAPGAPESSQPSAGSAAPGRRLAPNAGDIADAATSKAAPPRGTHAGGAPHPPGAPGAPGARPGATPPSAPAGGYVPTQFVSQLDPEGLEGVTGPGAPAPGAPKPPGAPQSPGAPKPPGGTPAGEIGRASCRERV
jgi:hypothetical protein